MIFGWYTLGRFRILARPLPENPAFFTHHIYLANELVGRQLTPPDLQQCEDRLREYREEHRCESNFRRFSHGRKIWNAKGA